MPTPAAQYLRMSTEHQQYSPDNQSSAIRHYAAIQGFEIVRTYSDAAKSGLNLKRRVGLRQLLQDVVSRNSPFKAVLVYDVSRWGRFQDSDEAAHYEFLCKSAGVPVHYCAETFANDGTLPSLIMKALKRTMAGEYSRELGVKVLEGQKRLARFGFKQGGLPGYGLRRMLVSGQGERKQVLKKGERKSIATDRVILVPGPTHEVQTVRDIFRMLVHEKRTVYSIACELNRSGIEYTGNSKWDYLAVHTILTHPKYAGAHVFGRTSQRLCTPVVEVPRAEWVITSKAFEPLVDQATFEAAQQILQNRTINKSDEEILDRLRALLAAEGRLDHEIIKNSTSVPSPSTYRHRFGGLRQTYERIGYGSSRDFEPLNIRHRIQALRNNLISKILACFPCRVSLIQRGGRYRTRLLLKGVCQISVLVSKVVRPWKETIRWQVHAIPKELIL